MKSITQTEFQENIEPIFQKVFVSKDPLGEPFQPQIRSRLLLYGFQYALSTPWLEPMVQSMRDLGEEGFYVSIVSEPSEQFKNQDFHWYVPINEADQYLEKVLAWESAIYSVSGHWGLICSYSEHALVGGPNLMIENIRSSVKDLDERVGSFLDDWKRWHETNGVDINWVSHQLSHIYGPDVAMALLRKAHIDIE